MKVMFLVPPALDGAKIPERVFGCTYGLYPIPNIFILSCGGILEQAGHRVAYLDCTVNGWDKSDFESFLNKDDSNLYCFYAVNLSQRTDLIAAQTIRRIKGKIPVAFLGPAPSDRPHEFLSDSRVFVIRGEPEETLIHFVRCLEDSGNFSEVGGLSSLRGNTPISNPPRKLIENLDGLPFPARHLLTDSGRYFSPKLGQRPFTAVLTSRGCGYGCIYCVPCSLSFAREIEYKRSHNGKKPPVRLRSAKNVIQEFNQLREDGYRAVTIIDDQFVWGKKRTIEICNGIKKTGIKWSCLARADHLLDEDVIRAMAEGGCQLVDIGVESFDQRILDYVEKSLDVRTVKEAAHLLRKHGILMKLNLLVGASPLETKETMERNLRMALEIGADWIMFNICNPFPGTKFYDLAVDNGWLVDGHYRAVDVQKEAIIDYPHLHRHEMERWVRYANLRLALRPSFILRNIKRQKSARDFFDALLSLKKKLVG